MLHSRKGVALSALAANSLLTSSPLAQEDREREFEVHYCVTDSGGGRDSRPGIKLSKAFSTSPSGLHGSVVGTVSFGICCLIQQDSVASMPHTVDVRFREISQIW